MTSTTTTAADTELRALLKRVRMIELKTRKAVNAAGQGAYHSRFKGRGMAFSESRAYVPGDDPRHIDWNATARRQQFSADASAAQVFGGELFVKQFVEERELTVLLAVDLSGSMSTGSRSRTKRQIAAEAAALLAFSALRNNDKVGLVAFTDRIELLVRPKKGRAHVLRLLREILALKPRGRGTDLKSAVETTTHLSKQRAVVVLISDLQSPSGSALSAAEKPLRVLARKHDLIAVEVEDPVESELPDAGLVSVEDPETGKRTVLDTSDVRVRTEYKKRMADERARVRAAVDKLGIERVTVTDQESSQALVRFLRRRARKAA